VKSKTFNALRHFRAGIEGNISELKRAFGATKAKWKGHDGFKAFVWASALSYNLVRLARLSPDYPPGTIRKTAKSVHGQAIQGPPMAGIRKNGSDDDETDQYLVAFNFLKALS